MKSYLGLLFFLFPILLWAQNPDCKVFHSNGTSYNLNIISVNELGLIDSSGGYIAYKSIDSLITNSESLFQQIDSHFSITHSKNNSGEYVILFDRTIYETEKHIPTMFDKHTMISLHSTDYCFASLHLQYRLTFTGELYHRIILNGGNTFTQPNHHSLNFGYGLGFKLPAKLVDIQLWFSFTTGSVYTTAKSDLYKVDDLTQYYFSLLGFFDLDDAKKFQLGVGFNIYLNRFEVENKKRQLDIQAGINVAI